MTLSLATPKQRAVLNAYIKHGSIKAAADALNIKEQCARHRLSALYRRTGVQNVAQAAYLLGREHQN